MIKFFFLSSMFFSLLSCSTIDVEKTIRDSSAGKTSTPGDSASIVLPERITVKQQPVFVPEKEAQKQQPTGDAAVWESNKAGIIKPSDFSHAAMIYDYDPDWVYEIYAQPLRVCDILLEPGERAVEVPFVSDSERWILGAGVSHENGNVTQHIYVKPETSGIDASLIINTDRRVYHIILRSYKNIHMPIVRWRYLSGMPNNYIQPAQAAGSEGDDYFSGIDPRFLSFNYKITYNRFKKPVWLPQLVFDDGSKTYITFPAQVLQRELPAVFENRGDVINYRVRGNVIIIDKLIENITVKIERREITILKKRK